MVMPPNRSRNKAHQRHYGRPLRTATPEKRIETKTQPENCAYTNLTCTYDLSHLSVRRTRSQLQYQYAVIAVSIIAIPSPIHARPFLPSHNSSYRSRQLTNPASGAPCPPKYPTSRHRLFRSASSAPITTSLLTRVHGPTSTSTLTVSIINVIHIHKRPVPYTWHTYSQRHRFLSQAHDANQHQRKCRSSESFISMSYSSALKAHLRTSDRWVLRGVF